MFGNPLVIKTSEGNIEQKPYEMLKPISRSKYPAITEVSMKLSFSMQRFFKME
jgi:hypothetical protein